jgi:glucose 1-dehydrogenase
METNKKMSGKKVLITGASSGIGKGIALEQARLGADVAINYFPSEDQENKAENFCREICREVTSMGCRTILLPADVSDEEEVLSMFKKLKDEWGGLDVLVNNAGIQKRTLSHELTLEDFNKVFTVNAVGTFLCTREALKIFLEKKIKGVVVNNTSVHQFIPKPEYLSYSMSKGAVDNLTKTLALEYAEHGIRFNNVAPGAIITPINPWSKNEERKEQIKKHIPMREIGTVEQVAKAVAFLSSDDSGYITGQTIFVDGGLTLYPEFGEDWSSS